MSKRNEKYEQILLLGCDVNQDTINTPNATPQDRCRRSDATVVLSLDKKTGKARLISLFRDVWVQIPEHGPCKLNEVVVHADPETAVRVVNECFGLCIRNYVLITLTGLVDLVDLLGGVDVSLTAAEAQYINERMPEVTIITERPGNVAAVAEGQNRLNGMQTLAHVRNRTIGQIIGRENRVNNVLTAMAQRAKREMRPRQLLRFALKAKKYVRTDLSFSDILRLVRFARHADLNTIAAYHAPAENTFTVKTDGVWRMEVDFARAGTMLWNFLERQDL